MNKSLSSRKNVTSSSSRKNVTSSSSRTSAARSGIYSTALEKFRTSKLGGVLTSLAKVGVSVCLFMLTAGLLFQRSWIGDLFISFSQHFLFLGIVSLIVLLISESSKYIAANLILVAVSAVVVVPHWFGGAIDSPSSADKESIRVLSQNVFVENDKHSDVVEHTRLVAPDVAFFYEMTPEWEAGLEDLQEDFPTWECSARADTMGLCIGATDPQAKVEFLLVGSDEVQTIFTTLELDGETVEIVGIHPPAPITPDLTKRRDSQLLAAAETLGGRGADHRLMFGDFNLTSYSPVFHQILDEASVADISRGRSNANTWQKFPTVLGGLKIDHALASEDVQVSGYELGPFLGSDHRPVYVDLSIS